MNPLRAFRDSILVRNVVARTLQAAEEKTYETREVLGGSYRGKDVEERMLLTHALVKGAAKSACGRIAEGRLADIGPDEPPTCEACLKKVTKEKWERV